jgi:hypothetical protein
MDRKPDQQAAGAPLSKGLTIVWSLLLSGLVIFLAVGALLPSTKRARIDLEELHRLRAQPATSPTTAEAQ